MSCFEERFSHCENVSFTHSLTLFSDMVQSSKLLPVRLCIRSITVLVPALLYVNKRSFYEMYTDQAGGGLFGKDAHGRTDNSTHFQSPPIRGQLPFLKNKHQLNNIFNLSRELVTSYP